MLFAGESFFLSYLSGGVSLSSLYLFVGLCRSGCLFLPSLFLCLLSSLSVYLAINLSLFFPCVSFSFPLPLFTFSSPFAFHPSFPPSPFHLSLRLPSLFSSVFLPSLRLPPPSFPPFLSLSSTFPVLSAPHFFSLFLSSSLPPPPYLPP